MKKYLRSLNLRLTCWLVSCLSARLKRILDASPVPAVPVITKAKSTVKTKAKSYHKKR